MSLGRKGERGIARLADSGRGAVACDEGVGLLVVEAFRKASTCTCVGAIATHRQSAAVRGEVLYQ